LDGPEIDPNESGDEDAAELKLTKSWYLFATSGYNKGRSLFSYLFLSSTI